MLNFKDIEKRLQNITGSSSDADIAKALGYNSRTAYQSVKQRNAIPYEKLLKFCLERGIDSISLIYGDRSGKEIIPRSLAKDYDQEQYYSIPYFSEVRAACGDGCSNDNLHQELLLLPKEKYSLPADTEAIKSFGDSMFPLVKEDSIILFKRIEALEQIKSSAVYIFNYEDQLFMKMLVQNPDNLKKVKSVSLNQSYPIQDLDFKDITIIGEFISTV